MNRIFGYLISAISMLTWNVEAHDVWITGYPTNTGMTAEIGYGHHFPERGTLPNREKYFIVPQLMDGTKTVPMLATSQAYVYETKSRQAEGSYIITTQMKPTFWSKTPEGWKPADKRQRPDVSYCQWAVKYAKSLLIVGSPASHNVHLQPTGQELEIVPMTDLIKMSTSPVKFQLLFRGEPLPNAIIELNSSDYIANQAKMQDDNHSAQEHHEHRAEITAKSDDKGIVTLPMLQKGEWIALIKHKDAFRDQMQCDDMMITATLSFIRA